jgi:ATP-dependent RNA helicase DDX23/PRP28
MQAIPIGLARKDMIGIAPTGSGKSAAYIIPLIIYLKTLKPINYDTAKDGPYSLILLPSRELAPQVEREFNSLAKDLKLKAFVCVGGR